MPRRQGVLSIYEHGEETFIEGTMFPIRSLVHVMDAVFFEQDNYSNAEGRAEQEVGTYRIRTKIRYSPKVQVNQAVHYLGNWYKVWRVWSDSRKYLEIYLSAWDFDSDGELVLGNDKIQ